MTINLNNERTTVEIKKRQSTIAQIHQKTERRHKRDDCSSNTERMNGLRCVENSAG